MSKLLFPKQKRLERLFYIMIAFSLIGPTLGIQITDNFNLTFFRITFLLLSAGIVLQFVWGKEYSRLKKNLEMTAIYQVRWYAVFFLFWFAYGVLALAWAPSVAYGIRYLFLLGMMLSLAIAFPFFLRTTQSFWQMEKILLGVFSAIIYFAFIESVTFIHLPSSRAFGDKLNATVTSVFTNQNDLATCITIALPFLITAMFMLNLKSRNNWFIYITGIFSIYALLATGSRSNTFFALPLALLVLIAGVPFVIRREKLTRKNIGKALIAALAAILIATSMSTIFLSEEARETIKVKLASTFSFLADLNKTTWDVEEMDPEDFEGTQESATDRKFLILNGLNYLKDSNFMGIGPGNIEFLNKKLDVVKAKNMHNWWVEILVNFGVIVFVLYMALYFWLLWRLWKLASLKYGASAHLVIRWGAFATLSSLIGFFVGGMAPSSSVHFTPFWITYGIGLALVGLGEMQKKKQEKNREQQELASSE
ncbi:O-antigen ligase family protein [Thermoactinomyces mirandus]|uniref:O-antigen ligase family protein n=1 Tax=Thermoactinomyces mirandus TaxID=2756294 RepID=A0A7W1XV86_9BACL|nr:O-antigen ligase family protein [Thermoactinomyces mirandus]MBA4603918.1 O-antigen ligase family protein [Thermoactinomyces mirandus]